MTRSHAITGVLLFAAGCQTDVTLDEAAVMHGSPSCEWTQLGRNADHDSRTCTQAQPLEQLLAQRTLDFTAVDDLPEYGALAHMQVPLSDDDGWVFVMTKTGDPFDVSAMVWHQKGMRWKHGTLEDRWQFTSDWRPSPSGGGAGALAQAALTDRWLWVPGAGGTLHKLDKRTGHVRGRVNPFGHAIDPDAYIHGGITADREGNLFYNVVKFDPADPRGNDVLGAWLVRVSRHGHVRKVDYRTLIPTAPAATDLCYLTFNQLQPRPPRPWPPVTPELPPQDTCLSQRPPVDATPAIGADGTIFVVTRAHRTDQYSYMVALRPDLQLRWATSMRGLLNDGCGVLATVCRDGATVGVDPETNMPPAARASDASSSAPVALPDGGVVYGALTIYNGLRGHTMKFDRQGAFAGSFDFGWDSTPGVWRHDDTYSLVLKDNYYDTGEYNITQVSADLEIEWSHTNDNTLECQRQPDGTISCWDVGWTFEWCVASPAIDRDGTVHVGSADGNLYAIGQGGVEQGRFFMDRTVFAVYAPTSIDHRGRVYAMNNGQLFVVGAD